MLKRKEKEKINSQLYFNSLLTWDWAWKIKDCLNILFKILTWIHQSICSSLAHVCKLMDTNRQIIQSLNKQKEHFMILASSLSIDEHGQIAYPSNSILKDCNKFSASRVLNFAWFIQERFAQLKRYLCGIFSMEISTRHCLSFWSKNHLQNRQG